MCAVFVFEHNLLSIDECAIPEVVVGRRVALLDAVFMRRRIVEFCLARETNTDCFRCFRCTVACSIRLQHINTSLAP